MTEVREADGRDLSSRVMLHCRNLTLETIQTPRVRSQLVVVGMGSGDR